MVAKGPDLDAKPCGDYLYDDLYDMIYDGIKFDPSKEDIEEMQARGDKQEMMEGMMSSQVGYSGENQGEDHREVQGIKTENNEPSTTLSLSFSCSSNLLANSPEIYFSQY